VADVANGSIRQIAPFAEPPISWSGDSRYVAAQVANQNKTSTQVIRLRDGHRHVFAVAGSVASIAFSPDDSRVVICAGDDYGLESLSLAATSSGRATSYGPLGACWGAWSRYGLAYTTTDATKYTFSTYADVLLRSPAHAQARTLYRLGPDGAASLVGWSGNGELLATTSDEAVRDPDDAVRLAEQAVALTERREPSGAPPADSPSMRSRATPRGSSSSRTTTSSQST